ncbi:hypothetical protein J7I94_17045 [Streptomyces sp. ISL-12]|uniref:hypothetical protein n=1 Tax=Streptomyces sp. ISL-12 TaxID=2819177 RepID=UPI001BE66BC1|nr:hypothetical protein [Streptomyces sp. ISL-12]MBT2412259.1 hypothetical protein [Streptomyces sp. ISL-12]
MAQVLDDEALKAVADRADVGANACARRQGGTCPNRRCVRRSVIFMSSLGIEAIFAAFLRFGV